jgi:hypothetical protein
MFGLPAIQTTIAIAITVVLAGTHWKAYKSGESHGANAVQVKWDQNLRDIAQHNLEQAKIGQQKAKDLQAAADRDRKNADQKLKVITDWYADTIDSLQDRARRPSPSDTSVPESTGPEPARCTGAGLYHDDAEFLTRIAADAARLQTEYQRCKAGYEKAVEQLKKGP